MRYVAHKVTWNQYREAKLSRRLNGFWNSAMTGLETKCGSEPIVIAARWEAVTCKRCLRLRTKEKTK